MDSFYKIIIAIALASVAIVLFLGLKNLATGGSPNLSQKLMRMRILLQAIAIGVLLLGLYIFGK
ncbi:MAG: twin transmembrane helix small protein [Rhizobiales bacterium]|nr:twin transmembrane helix small protein [Hyphomicrobiales bacterium]